MQSQEVGTMCGSQEQAVRMVEAPLPGASNKSDFFSQSYSPELPPLASKEFGNGLPQTLMTKYSIHDAFGSFQA